MSEHKENYELYGLLILLLSIAFLVLGFDWLVEINVIRIMSTEGALKSIYSNLRPNIFLFRIGYVLLTLGMFFVKKPKNFRKVKTFHKVLFATISYGFFLLGYSNYEVFNIVFYPILFFSCIYASYLVFLDQSSYKDEEIFGVTKEKTQLNLSYSYNTDQGKLNIHSAEQHIFVSGGSGSGKSESILKPTIYQHVFKDFPALIYDFKGNPMTLGKTAYTAFYNYEKKYKKNLKTQLKFFNFTDVTRSFRINPLDPIYLKTIEDVNLFVTNFIKSFNPEFREKEDVWYRGAKAFWMALIIRFLKDDDLKDKICFPILIEILLNSDSDSVVDFISENETAKKVLAPVLVSAKGNPKQFTGYYTSAQDIVSNLVENKDLYWLLSANEINLDINNKDNPTFLCIASEGKIGSSFQPILAGVVTVIMGYFAEQNKLPTLFQLDEIYTLYLDSLPGYANTFRSNGVCMQIGNQTDSMLEDLYKKSKANNIKSACGNQFYGMTNDVNTAKPLSELLSDINVYNKSLNTSDSSQSIGESYKRQRVMEIRDITGQKTGHFSGKIANGNPPYFSLQFERFKHHDKELEVPQFVLEEYTKEELVDSINENYQDICVFVKELLSQYESNDEPISKEKKEPSPK